MAIKNKAVDYGKDRVLTKYVKSANMWCRTTFSSGHQKTEWFSTQKEAEEIN